MPVIVIVLSLLLMCFMGLATAVQRTIRALGLRPRGSETRAEARAQIVILLGVYLRCLNLVFLLAMSVYLMVSRASVWQYGAIVALCWIGSLLMGGIPRLQPGSAEMVRLLVADLERRRSWYQIVHNTTRLHAIEDLLTHLKSVPRIPNAPGLHR